MARKSLRRELTLAILFKIAAIVLLWALFFSPSHRMRVTPAEMAATLANGAPPR